MVIQRYGDFFLKLSAGERVLAINPPAKGSKHKSAKFGAEIMLASMRHPDCTGVDAVTYNKNEPFVIKGPGEYEISDIFIRGHGQVAMYDGEPRVNTIYSLLFDGANIVYLGALDKPEVEEVVSEELYQADIIFVPIGGGDQLEAPEAAKFVKKFSPRVVIPLAYDKAALKAFLSEFGSDATEQDKLTIKKKDLEGESLEIIPLKNIN